MSKFFFGTKVKAYYGLSGEMHAYLPLPSGEKRDSDEASLVFLDGDGDVCIFDEDFAILDCLAEIVSDLGQGEVHKVREKDMELDASGKYLDLKIPKWINSFVCPFGYDVGYHFYLGFTEQYDHVRNKLMYFMVLRGERSF